VPQRLGVPNTPRRSRATSSSTFRMCAGHRSRHDQSSSNLPDTHPLQRDLRRSEIRLRTASCVLSSPTRASADYCASAVTRHQPNHDASGGRNDNEEQASLALAFRRVTNYEPELLFQGLPLIRLDEPNAVVQFTRVHERRQCLDTRRARSFARAARIPDRFSESRSGISG